MAYLIDIIVPMKPVYRALPQWARDSLNGELFLASLDPHSRTTVSPTMPLARLLPFADNRGLAMYQIDEVKERIEVRQIHWPL